MGILEEREAPVMTESKLFEMYNDKEDHLHTPNKLSIFSAVVPAILLVIFVIYCVISACCRKNKHKTHALDGEGDENDDNTLKS